MLKAFDKTSTVDKIKEREESAKSNLISYYLWFLECY